MGQGRIGWGGLVERRRERADEYNTIRYGTIRFDTIRDETIRYETIQYDATRYDTIRYDTMRYDTVRYGTIRYDTIRYDTIRYETIRYDAMRHDTIRYDTMRYDTAQGTQSRLKARNGMPSVLFSNSSVASHRRSRASARQFHKHMSYPIPKTIQVNRRHDSLTS